ncbi:hypothetical protein C0995_000127 [Termitomyces sp. Mi166|nr:hypothetical protein C0995_000127 [Termitomyces sp. Mi166\
MASDIAHSDIPAHPLEEHAWKSHYTLSQSSQAEFRSLLEGLRGVLSQHDAKIARVQATLDQLLDERKSYVLRIDKLKSALASHKKLPPELLSKIFKDCSPSPVQLPPDNIRDINDEPRTARSSSGTRSILPTMAVCSRWREIALNSRDLWDGVVLSYHRSPLQYWTERTRDMTERAQKIISRGTRSIVIHIFNKSSRDIPPESIDPMRNLIIPFSHQLVHIQLVCSIYHLFDFLQSSSPSFPVLESLTLKGDAELIHEYEVVSQLTMFKDTPNLKTLAIRDFKVRLISMPLSQFQLPWDQLTEIDFRDTWLNARTVHWVLSQCTSAVSCWFSPCHNVVNTQLVPLATIVQPHLRLLSVMSSNESPNIITGLRVEDSLPGLLSLIPRSHCILAKLSIPEAQIPISLLDPLLELLPALEDLDIPKATIPIPTLERIAQGVLLPKLTNLACIIESSPRSLESFMDAVERTGTEDSEVTRLRVASARFPPTERHYKAPRWPKAIERLMKLAEKLREEGRSISLPGFRGLL